MAKRKTEVTVYGERKMSKLPHMGRPCRDCPFRKDTTEGWLGKERMQQILASESFVCHKDTGKQCAGHMLIKGGDNSFVRLAGRLGIDLNLRGRELVFDTEGDCVDHHTFLPVSHKVVDAYVNVSRRERKGAESMKVLKGRETSGGFQLQPTSSFGENENG